MFLNFKARCVFFNQDYFSMYRAQLLFIGIFFAHIVTFYRWMSCLFANLVIIVSISLAPVALSWLIFETFNLLADLKNL